MRIMSHWVYSITTRIKTKNKKMIVNSCNTHWVYSITTRIKTNFFHIYFIVVLIEYIPLQQGLRHVIIWFSQKRTAHWVYSITTRIKTPQQFLFLYCSPSHWVYSITTRIKTLVEGDSAGGSALIEYIPLQQGLRRQGSE